MAAQGGYSAGGVESGTGGPPEGEAVCVDIVYRFWLQLWSKIWKFPTPHPRFLTSVFHGGG